MLYALAAVSALALAVYGVLDVLRTPAGQVRGLPRPLWALVCLLPLVGTVSWLLVGRAAPAAAPRRPAAPPRHPDDDEEFLRQLRRRAEEQRRRAGEQEPPEPA